MGAASPSQKLGVRLVVTLAKLQRELANLASPRRSSARFDSPQRAESRCMT